MCFRYFLDFQRMGKRNSIRSLSSDFSRYFFVFGWPKDVFFFDKVIKNNKNKYLNHLLSYFVGIFF